MAANRNKDDIITPRFLEYFMSRDLRTAIINGEGPCMHCVQFLEITCLFISNALVFQALLTLFVFSTKDGWVTIMYDGIDAVDIDKEVTANICLVILRGLPEACFTLALLF